MTLKDIKIYNKQPKIHFVKTGFFDFWLKSKGKLGGKIKYLDQMTENT